jgi:hypothetical protein
VLNRGIVEFVDASVTFVQNMGWHFYLGRATLGTWLVSMLHARPHSL